MKNWQFSVRKYNEAYKGYPLGPSIDVTVRDYNTWDLKTSTILVDFDTPKHCTLEYSNTDGTTSQPFMLRLIDVVYFAVV